MKKIFLLFFAAFVFVVNCENDESYNKIWAVLVAGSNTYTNYRHQANVLHAYQILNKKHGIPKEQIVLMMYDDIAYDEENPFKGNVINYPGGKNLYTDDIEKDFTGEDVSSKNFLKVLLGDEKLKKSGKKVLQSNENDHVFVYYTDHGGDGLVGFPSDLLYASNLIETLEKMQKKKMFKKLTFYLEACHSGSMFDGLLKDNLNIYGVSSAKPDESTYAKYLDEKRGIYLTDEFSISWLLDSEENDKKKVDELLNEQFETVKNLTESSTCNQYGDLKIASQYYVSDFIGKPIPNYSYSDSNYLNYYPDDKMNSRDVEFFTAKLLSQKNNDNKFETLVKNRNMTSNFVNQLSQKLSLSLNVNYNALTTKSKIENRECYEQLVDIFNNHCANISKHTYLLRHLHIFKNTCNIIKKNEEENILTVDVNELKEEMKSFCQLYKNSFSKIEKVV